MADSPSLTDRLSGVAARIPAPRPPNGRMTAGDPPAAAPRAALHGGARSADRGAATEPAAEVAPGTDPGERHGRTPGWARRIEAATPAGRDRGIDALRALAVLGVILGHWLVTAVVDRGQGVLVATSPLKHLPWLAPVSWVFQTLAVFFLVGGEVAARGHLSARRRGIGYRRWLGRRLARLSRPVAPLLGVWLAAFAVMIGAEADPDTLRTMATLVLSPLWFLLVFAVLTAATPVAVRIHPAVPLAVVAVADLIRFGLGGQDRFGAILGPVSLLAGWLVPYTLGAAWASGRLRSRRCGWLLLTGGTAVAAALVLWAGYPASMVGVPGERISNLNPPTLAAVAFGLAQCGLASLLRERLTRIMARPVAWAAVALINLSAMTLFLWHQTAMLAVTAVGLFAAPLPGLHTVPDALGWVPARIVWLPLFAIALAVCWAAFSAAERDRSAGSARDAAPAVPDARRA